MFFLGDLKKFLLFFLAIGIFLRLIAMPFSFHPDLLYLHFNSQFFSQNVFDIYSFLQQNNFCVGIDKACYGYSPLSYWLIGFFDMALKPFNPLFFEWLQNALAIAVSGISGNGTTLNYVLAEPANGNIFLHLFLMKLPYLFFDLGIAFLLLGFFGNEREKLFAFAFWMLNPIAIFSTFFFGQFDVFAVFFMILGIYFARKGFFSKGMASFGIAIALKVFPALVLLPVLLILPFDFAKKAKYALISAIFPILTFLPFALLPVFWNSFVFAGIGKTGSYAFYTVSGLIARIFGIVGIKVDYNFFPIPVFPVILAAFLLFIWSRRKNFGQNFEESVIMLPFAVLLLFFAFSEFSPHWFLWIIPFFALIVSRRQNLLKYFLILAACYAVIVLNFGSNLSWNLLIPLNHSFALMPGAGQWLGIFWKPIYAIARIGFFTACIFFFFNALKFDFKAFAMKVFLGRKLW